MPIVSIDIHPDGSRVATGGQGEDSGRIVIWNMAPVVSEEKELDEDTPRMLCQLDNHLACVNCVRWSWSGKYLASGGDDKLVMIWTVSKSSASNTVFGSKGKVNIEGWRCAHTLRLHQGDVLDMAWSPSDAWLATCSVDNTIIVWRAENLPEVVRILKGHTGMVKGVTWDPVGKYLGSQSDDKTVRIWRTVDWSLETVVSEPFQQCCGSTMVLRLSWSPDGQYLVTAHAMNGSAPTAQIIEREGWTHNKDFVGHQKAVTCVRYSGVILETEKKGRVVQSCTCAIGSRDRGVSIWTSTLQRPIVVVDNLFSSPINDLGWSPTGLSLMACSSDGSTAYMEFTEAEVGTPLSPHQKSELFEKLYGKVHVGDQTSLVVVENPEVLQVESLKVEGATNSSSSTKKGEEERRVPSDVSPKQPPAQRPTKQIETRTSDGKRRITPIFIPPDQDTREEVVPFGSNTTFSSSTNKSWATFNEKKEETVSPKKLPSPIVAKPSILNHPSFPAAMPTNKIGPSSLGGDSGGFKGLMKTTEKVDLKGCGGLKRRAKGSPKERRKALHTEEAGVLRSAPSHPPLFVPLPFNPSQTHSVGSNLLKVENSSHKSLYGNLSFLRFSGPGDSKPRWELALGSEVCGVVCSGEVVVAACADHTLHILSNQGHKLLPPVPLPSLPSALALSKSDHLLCVTTSGDLLLWTLRPHPKEVLRQSIASLIKGSTDLRIKECLVSDNGEPMLVMSNGKAFYYSQRHSSWLLVGNSSDPVLRHTHHNFRMALRSHPHSSLPLKTLQSATLNGMGAGSSSGSGFGASEVSGICTSSYLEAQVLAAEALSSPTEYRFWLLNFVRHLVHQANEHKLRWICEKLLGPPHPNTLGLSSKSLLEDILKEMAGQLRFQRLYLELMDQIHPT